MIRYSSERKGAVLKKLLPPQSLSVVELYSMAGISDVTLYAWRRQAKAGGHDYAALSPSNTAGRTA